MPEAVHLIPLAEIADDALPRDRTGLDAEPLRELRDSILASGLRMPVELFELPEPRGERRYGILSGFRRVAAFREIHGFVQADEWARIPAFLRAPAGLGAALAAMVEENEIRADLSPWEKGRIALVARDAGSFPTIEAAVDALYPTADATRRSRLRTIARLVESLDGTLTDPEKLTLRQLLRLANACRNGFTTLIQTALEQSSMRTPEHQWQLLQPVLAESERFTRDDPDHEPGPDAANRGRPRRLVRLGSRRIIIRREMARDGYLLRFTGRDATSGLLDEVLDEIERLFGTG
jgi:ParB family transcriptional regulator, chromosome partitioning protein